MKAWLPVACYVAAIFASMPYMPLVVRAFQQSYAELLAPLIIAAFVGWGIAVLAYAARVRRQWHWPVICWFAVAVGGVLGMAALLETPVEKIHLVEYAVLSVLLYRRFESRSPAGRAKPLLLAVGAAGIIGYADELYQWYLPNRYFGWLDVLSNVLGAILGLVIWLGVMHPPEGKDALQRAAVEPSGSPRQATSDQ